jgi:hypothetical protein
MAKESKYQKLLEDAAWYADPVFDYKINVKEEDPNEVLLARGNISIENPYDKSKFNYNFAIGVDGNILFSKGARTKGGYLVDMDLRKSIHDEIINFNESLAIGIGARRIVVNNEMSEKVRGLYLSRGYNINDINNQSQRLEKKLK